MFSFILSYILCEILQKKTWNLEKKAIYFIADLLSRLINKIMFSCKWHLEHSLPLVTLSLSHSMIKLFPDVVGVVAPLCPSSAGSSPTLFSLHHNKQGTCHHHHSLSLPHMDMQGGRGQAGLSSYLNRQWNCRFNSPIIKLIQPHPSLKK